MRLRKRKKRAVRSVGIVAIEPAGTADVYNLEVFRHHNFSICGGLIVHNCSDALRYFVYTVIYKKHGMEVLK